MKKTILTCCMLANTAVFSDSLSMSEEECNKNYMREVLIKSEWQNDKLVDTKKGYSYTVLDLATNADLGISPQERQDLKLFSKVQFTQLDPKANTCTVTLLKRTGGNRTIQLTPHSIE